MLNSLPLSHPGSSSGAKGSRLAFPIVALGASAGGLEALFEFLCALPSKSGMAYVVIQHLDRDHKSLLAELLAKKTTELMEV